MKNTLTEMYDYKAAKGIDAPVNSPGPDIAFALQVQILHSHW